MQQKGTLNLTVFPSHAYAAYSQYWTTKDIADG